MNDDARAGPRIVVAANSDALALKAATQFVELARASVGARGEFRVALSGGNTPRALYAALVSDRFRDEVSWECLQIFFSDERFVPPESDQSNFHTAWSGLLSHVPIPEAHVHRVLTIDVQPEQAAERYEAEIRHVFGTEHGIVPSFDLILLGMGPDGHTASLFPGTEALKESRRLVVPNYVEKMGAWRITFTYPLLNAASVVTFLVQGDDKRDPLSAILAGNSGLPAEGVAPPEGHVVWIVDRAAEPASPT